MSFVDRHNKIVWHEAMVAKGHAPKVDEDGIIDMFAVDGDHHAGPMCETCYWSCCTSCSTPDEIPQCTDPVLTITATRVIR